MDTVMRTNLRAVRLLGPQISDEVELRHEHRRSAAFFPLSAPLSAHLFRDSRPKMVRDTATAAPVVITMPSGWACLRGTDVGRAWRGHRLHLYIYGWASVEPPTKKERQWRRTLTPCFRRWYRETVARPGRTSNSMSPIAKHAGHLPRV